ncbi:hypothetical protein L1887_31753 [Cichorium endivia]|nr:hypothetical protein L1887_31753 [Cichorium endivia]
MGGRAGFACLSDDKQGVASITSFYHSFSASVFDDFGAKIKNRNPRFQNRNRFLSLYTRCRPRLRNLLNPESQEGDTFSQKRNLFASYGGTNKQPWKAFKFSLRPQR